MIRAVAALFLSASSAILFLTSHYPPPFLPPFFSPRCVFAICSPPSSSAGVGESRAERTAVLNIGFFLSTIPFSFLSISPGSFLPHNPFFPFRSLRKSPPPLTFFPLPPTAKRMGKGGGESYLPQEGEGGLTRWNAGVRLSCCITWGKMGRGEEIDRRCWLNKGALFCIQRG